MYAVNHPGVVQRRGLRHNLARAYDGAIDKIPTRLTSHGHLLTTAQLEEAARKGSNT